MFTMVYLLLFFTGFADLVLGQECIARVEPDENPLSVTKSTPASIVCICNCTDSGSTNPVAWFNRHGERVPPVGRVFSIPYNRGQNIRLILANPDIQDNGMYTCTGTVRGQRVRQDVNINVIDPNAHVIEFVDGDERPRRGDVRIDEPFLPNKRPVRDVQNRAVIQRERREADKSYTFTTTPEGATDVGKTREVEQAGGSVSESTKSIEITTYKTPLWRGMRDSGKMSTFQEGFTDEGKTRQVGETGASESKATDSIETTTDKISTWRVKRDAGSTVSTLAPNDEMNPEGSEENGVTDSKDNENSTPGSTAKEATSTKSTQPEKSPSKHISSSQATTTTTTTATPAAGGDAGDEPDKPETNTEKYKTVEHGTEARTAFGRYGLLAFALALSAAFLLLYTLILLNVILPRCCWKKRSVSFRDEGINKQKETGPTAVDFVALKPLDVEAAPNSPDHGFTTVDLDDKPDGNKPEDKLNGAPASPASSTEPQSPSKYVTTFTIGRKPSTTDPAGVFIHEGKPGETVSALPEEAAEAGEKPAQTTGERPISGSGSVKKDIENDMDTSKEADTSTDSQTDSSGS